MLIAGFTVWEYREELGLVGQHGIGSSSVRGASRADEGARPPRINWERVDRAKDGFRVEMPADSKQITIPAFNEGGGTEPVNMIYANPDGATSFAVAWQDNPPVVRVNEQQPERILDQARDGAMARTQTTLVSESRANYGGNPTRDFLSRNSGGGILDSRLIYAGNRLYMLMVVFPSMSARREQDVTRFYNSFSAASGSGIPQTLPPAPAPARE